MCASNLISIVFVASLMFRNRKLANWFNWISENPVLIYSEVKISDKKVTTLLQNTVNMVLLDNYVDVTTMAWPVPRNAYYKEAFNYKWVN